MSPAVPGGRPRWRPGVPPPRRGARPTPAPPLHPAAAASTRRFFASPPTRHPSAVAPLRILLAATVSAPVGPAPGWTTCPPTSAPSASGRASARWPRRAPLP
eukprot:982365-Pleurochrysis_carterae.AAC.1